MASTNDKTERDALVALAEVLPPKPLPNMDYSYEVSPAHARELHSRFDRLVEALAAPKGGVVDGFDTWFDEYSKQNYDDYMLARAAWNASPAASVDVEGLREVAARCDAYAKHRKMTAYWRPAFVSLHRMLVTLIDSAGGAKRDIADAVMDPNGTCPTCHQTLRTDAALANQEQS